MKRHRPSGTSAINGDGHVIGLDIGATAVRAAVVRPIVVDGIPSVSVVAIGQVALPDGAVVSGVVTDEAAVVKALKHLWRTNHIRGHRVVLGITNQQIVVRDLQMPVLPPDQLLRALPFRAREVVAMPLEQALLDFVPLGDPNTDRNTQEGLLIAAPRQPVVAAVEAVEQAGLRVARVDLASFAALRSCAHGGLTGEAVIDLGAHLTNVVVHNMGVPKVVRTVGQGGHGLTMRLAERLDLSLPDAEAAKVQNGLRGSDRRVVDLLTEAVRPMLAEIRSSIQYFSVNSDGAPIERITLTGGGAALRGVSDELAEQTGVPVDVVPAAFVAHEHWAASKHTRSGPADGAASAVALGLGMGVAA